MNDIAQTIESNSTVLEPVEAPAASGGGTPDIPADDAGKPDKPEDVRDSIAKALKASDAKTAEAKAKEAGEEPKDAKEGKPADDADAAEKPAGEKDGKAEGKAGKADKDGAEPAKADKGDDGKPVEGKGETARGEAEGDDAKENGKGKPAHYQPPKNLLPDAREKWTNVPRAVQRDIENMTREHDAKVQELTKATERYEAVREFDELAQSNGRDLRESLGRLNQIENLMQENPYAGLNAILQEIGPRKPDGSPVSLREVSKFIAQQGDDGWQQLVAARPQQQQQQQQPDPQVVQLQQQIAKMQVDQTAASVIEPFKAEHPRYDELKGDIAMFLKSGRIPASLSAHDRLEAAYDMAERLNPPSNGNAASPDASLEPDRRVDPAKGSSGSLSIKSAPGSVTENKEPDRGGDIRDMLARNMRKAGRS